MIGQSTAFPLSAKITKKDGTSLDFDKIVTIEVTVDTAKYYYRKDATDNKVIKDPDREDYFIIMLQQEDTVKFKKGQVGLQVRIKMDNGVVSSSEVIYKNVCKALSEVIL